MMFVHAAPFVKQSAMCLSLAIQFSSILPFLFISLMAGFSTQSLPSAIWVVVLALL